MAGIAITLTNPITDTQIFILEKKYTWYRIVGNEAEIPFQPNNMAVVEVNGKKISLARIRDNLFAFAYKCPHASGILTEGWMDPKDNIVCPIHKYRFNIENGRNTTGEGYRLTCWPVQRRPEGIFVGMEDGAFGG